MAIRDTSLPAQECKGEFQDSSPGHFIYNGARSVPLGAQRKNVILFGETGVGKSSVINLMAGREVASTSSNLEGCTLQAAEYSFTLSDSKMTLCVFDTIGIEEPEMGVNSFIGAVEKAYRLITSLHNAGGVDLLLLCVRGGRLTTAMQRNYRLFSEILCSNRVPLALVITHLENENVMEDWWDRNEKIFKKYGVHAIAHACITALPRPVPLYAEKRARSQHALHDLLCDTLNNPNLSYTQDVRSWFATIINRLGLYLKRKTLLNKKDLSRILEARCLLSRDEAQRLAEMLAGEGKGHD